MTIANELEDEGMRGEQYYDKNRRRVVVRVWDGECSLQLTHTKKEWNALTQQDIDNDYRFLFEKLKLARIGRP